MGYLEEGCAEPVRLWDRIECDELLTGLVVSDAPWRDRVERIHSFMTVPGGADYLPVRYGAIPALFASGALALDVAYVHASPAMTLGFHGGYMPEVLAAANRIVVEVNQSMPDLPGSVAVPRADEVVQSDRGLLELRTRPPSARDRAVAANVATLVPSGATLEVGLGALPDAILGALADGRGKLRLFSGMLGDAVVDLAASGALADGEIVTTTLLGTGRLFEWARSEPRLRISTASEVHSVARLAAIDGFVAVNSALEVDLTGQVGAEQVAGRRISGIGGQADFAAGATLARRGRSIFALPAARIVDHLSGPVSTPRVDVTYVVTEHGVAELAGKTLEERERALRAIRGSEAGP